VREHGIRETEERPDTVIVSIDRDFTYRKLDVASSLVRAGARFVATNTDACLATEDRLVPGTGSIVAAVATAARRPPDTVIGKPGRLLFDDALREAGCAADEALAVGDNLATDIAAAASAGIRSVLLLTGISRPEDIRPGGPQPTWIAEDYAALSNLIFGGDPP
jgi:4-nitrophenyl phosphatase